jgi:hypothetical protein
VDNNEERRTMERRVEAHTFRFVHRFVGEDGVGYRWCSRRWVLPVAVSSRSIGLAVRSEWLLWRQTSWHEPLPPPPLYCAARRGPTSRVVGLGVPDQDAVKGSVSTVGSRRMRSILTFSPLISYYTLTLNFDFNCFHFNLFHHKSVYRACLIVTVSRR